MERNGGGEKTSGEIVLKDQRIRHAGNTILFSRGWITRPSNFRGLGNPPLHPGCETTDPGPCWLRTLAPGVPTSVVYRFLFLE